MYPYGGGYPPNQPGYPPAGGAYPPAPGGYPPAAGGYPPAPNQSPYPPNSSPYPPTSAPGQYPGYPTPGGYPPQASYPGQTQPQPYGNFAAPVGLNPGGGYPPAQPAYPGYPPATEQSGYPPPQSQQPYPPQNSSAYPPVAGAPPSSQAPYPGQPPQGASPYPPIGGAAPSSQATYPGQPSQGASPYPPVGGAPPSSQAPYPGQPPQGASPYPPVGGAPPSAGYQAYGGAGAAIAPPLNAKPVYSDHSSLVGNAQAVQRKGTPSIRPSANFDATHDANSLRKAMKGFGTDDKALIGIICKRTNEQRQLICRDFKQCFGRDLIQDVKSETSGNFEEILVALLQPTTDYYVSQLRNAMKGMGTDEDVLIEIFCTLSNAEIHNIKRAYEYKYRIPLERSIQSETSGYFQRLLTSLCNGGRDESMQTNISQAQQDAQTLYAAGEGRAGTDEEAFNLVLCRRNFAQLKLICQEYNKKFGRTLEKAIKSEFSGDIEDGLVALVRCCNDRADFFASQLHKAMAGLGTNDTKLIRILVTRCDVDLEDIKTLFEMKYGKSLHSWLKGEASGSYKHALLAVAGFE